MIVKESPACSENGLWSDGPRKTKPRREICLVGEAVIIVPAQPEVQSHVPEKPPVVLNEGAVIVVAQRDDVVPGRDAALRIQEVHAGIHRAARLQIRAARE